jgi:hypothetical protein
MAAILLLEWMNFTISIQEEFFGLSMFVVRHEEAVLEDSEATDWRGTIRYCRLNS